MRHSGASNFGDIRLSPCMIMKDARIALTARRDPLLRHFWPVATPGIARRKPKFLCTSSDDWLRHVYQRRYHFWSTWDSSFDHRLVCLDEFWATIRVARKVHSVDADPYLCRA